jgi:mono/diheme cytochrome c family protein
LLLAFAFAIPAFAGGWAVITLDELPTHIVAGEPLTIGFTVRQHGITPMSGIDPTVTATLGQEERFSVRATPDATPGHYTATLTFPVKGEWIWSIQAFTMDQPMPVLQVGAPVDVTASRPAVESEPAIPAVPPAVILRGLAVAVGLAGLVLLFRQRNRTALGLTVTGIAMGLASFLVSPAVPEVEAQRLAAEPSMSQVDLGRQLFVAKGCITCHVNNRVEDAHLYWTIDMGAPNLSNYSSAPEILFIRLKDPAEAKSDTKMPDLGLKEAEIEALIAFINSQ